MKRTTQLLTAMLAGLLFGATAHGAELRPFVSGSMQEVGRAYAGRPFVLALWSLSCPHCQEELERFGRLKEKYPELTLVLVSTDSPEDDEAIAATLTRQGLARAEAWVFADTFTERLRHEIDPRWSGELPRSYFFDRAHVATARSGAIPATELERWIARQETRAEAR